MTGLKAILHRQRMTRPERNGADQEGTEQKREKASDILGV